MCIDELGDWMWSFMLGLETLIKGCISWNPSYACLVLMCHLRLTFDHGIDWNSRSLGRGYWPSCHASSNIKLAIVHEIHSSNLHAHLFGISSSSRFGHCIHSYGVFKIFGPWLMVIASILMVLSRSSITGHWFLDSCLH